MILKDVHRAAAFAILASASVAGCAAPTTTTQVAFAPNVPAAAQLRHVAVLPFQGPSGPQATIEFESMLAQINQDGQAFFTVVDRRTLQNAVDQLKLNRTGLIDPKTAAQIGKMIGVDGIYTGTVFIPPTVRTTHQESRSHCNDAPSGKIISLCKSTSTYTITCTDKAVQYTLVPRLVAVSTAQVIYQPTMTIGRRASYCEDQGIGQADEMLLADARTEVFRKVRDDVGPHVYSFDLRLKTDKQGMTSDAGKRFDDALAFAKSGRMDRACGAWTDLAPENPNSLSLSYDLAVCDEASGRLAAALDRYTKIDSALSRPDTDINAALIRVRDHIAAQQKLQSMSAPPPQVTAPATPGKKVPPTRQ